MRRITSLTAALTFLLVVLTSIILYIVPQGRVAYWADWRLWGLSKTDWGNIHINLGFLFLIALGLHIYYNWKLLTAYLKDRARRFKLFTREFNIALAFTVCCTLGSYFLIPPFNWVMALSDHFKETAAAKYGEPPYGHAELSSLRIFARKMNLDLNKSLALLHKAGIKVKNYDFSLADIAKEYKITPKQLYKIIESATVKKDRAEIVDHILPASPMPRTGNLSLTEFCKKHSLNVDQVIRRLKEVGIEAEKNATIKTISSDNNIAAIDLYERIRTFQ